MTVELTGTNSQLTSLQYYDIQTNNPIVKTDSNWLHSSGYRSNMIDGVETSGWTDALDDWPQQSKEVISTTQLGQMNYSSSSSPSADCTFGQDPQSIVEHTSNMHEMTTTDHTMWFTEFASSTDLLEPSNPSQIGISSQTTYMTYDPNTQVTSPLNGQIESTQSVTVLEGRSGDNCQDVYTATTDRWFPNEYCLGPQGCNVTSSIDGRWELHDPDPPVPLFHMPESASWIDSYSDPLNQCSFTTNDTCQPTYYTSFPPREACQQPMTDNAHAYWPRSCRSDPLDYGASSLHCGNCVTQKPSTVSNTTRSASRENSLKNDTAGSDAKPRQSSRANLTASGTGTLAVNNNDAMVAAASAALANFHHRGSLQLWQFLVALLDDAKSQHLICWTGRTLEFKLNEPEEVARLWGIQKNRPAMNYDKLSRSLRYYYEKGIIQKVSGERYVYRFVYEPELLFALAFPGEEQQALAASSSYSTTRPRPHHKFPPTENLPDLHEKAHYLAHTGSQSPLNGTKLTTRSSEYRQTEESSGFSQSIKRARTIENHTDLSLDWYYPQTELIQQTTIPDSHSGFHKNHQSPALSTSNVDVPNTHPLSRTKSNGDTTLTNTKQNEWTDNRFPSLSPASLTTSHVEEPGIEGRVSNDRVDGEWNTWSSWLNDGRLLSNSSTSAHLRTSTDPSTCFSCPEQLACRLEIESTARGEEECHVDRAYLSTPAPDPVWLESAELGFGSDNSFYASACQYPLTGESVNSGP